MSHHPPTIFIHITYGNTYIMGWVINKWCFNTYMIVLYHINAPEHE